MDNLFATDTEVPAFVSYDRDQVGAIAMAPSKEVRSNCRYISYSHFVRGLFYILTVQNLDCRSVAGSAVETREKYRG